MGITTIAARLNAKLAYETKKNERQDRRSRTEGNQYTQGQTESCANLLPTGRFYECAVVWMICCSYLWAACCCMPQLLLLSRFLL